MCGRHFESLEDLSITHFGSLNGAHNNDALCFTEGVVASTDRSKMVTLIARTRSLGLAVPFEQGSNAHVLVPGSFWSGNPPTRGALRNLAKRGIGLWCEPCPPRCMDSCTRTQPFTMPMFTPTEKNQTVSGWRKRNSVSVLVTVCGYVWRIRRILGKPESGRSVKVPGSKFCAKWPSEEDCYQKNERETSLWITRTGSMA